MNYQLYKFHYLKYIHLSKQQFMEVLHNPHSNFQAIIIKILLMDHITYPQHTKNCTYMDKASNLSHKLSST